MIQPVKGIPIRKSPETIAFYIEEGKKFGQVLKNIYKEVKTRTLNSGSDVESHYISLCNKTFPHLDKEFPFLTQKNPTNIQFNRPICVSINDCAVHGLQHNQRFEPKDIVSLDFGLKLNSWNFDAAFTTLIPPVSNNVDCQWIKLPLFALREIVSAQPISTTAISKIIENKRRWKGQEYCIINAFSGHGIGKDLHEPPVISNLANYNFSIPLFEGLCFCAEPMYSSNKSPICDLCTTTPKTENIYLNEDGWSAYVMSGADTTHWETMFVVNQGKIVDLIGITDWEL